MLVKLQPQAFFSFLFRHLKGNSYAVSKASEKLSLFFFFSMRNVLDILDIYVIILMKWFYLLFSEEMLGIFGVMFFKGRR